MDLRSHLLDERGQGLDRTGQLRGQHAKDTVQVGTERAQVDSCGPAQRVVVLDRLGEQRKNRTGRHGRHAPGSDRFVRRQVAQRTRPGPGVPTVVLGGRQTPHHLVVQLRRQSTAPGAVQSHLVTAPVQHIHVRGLAVLVRLGPKGHNPGQQVQRFQRYYGHRFAHGTPI